MISAACWNFYPRSPCGERQINGSLSPAHQHISIHALLAESDARFKRERKGMIAFLSTLSLRRATCDNTYTLGITDISIHALLAESDHLIFSEQSHIIFLSTLSLRRATENHEYHLPDSWDFYPRSPCGERLDVNGVQGYRTLISIHALLAERDPPAPPNQEFYKISIHALLAESDWFSYL